MGKIFAILFIIIAIWIGLELYTQGARNALGGALSFLSRDAGTKPQEQNEAWAGKRAEAAVERAHRKHQERYERQLEE